MQAVETGRIWSGPVASPEQAARVVRWAGWTYLVLALPYPVWTAWLGARAADGPAAITVGMIPGLLFLGPGLLLLLLRNRTAAVVQVIASAWSALAVFLGGTAATLLTVAESPESGLAQYVLWLEAAVLLWAAAWAACAMLGLRAFKAAKMLRAVHAG